MHSPPRGLVDQEYSNFSELNRHWGSRVRISWDYFRRILKWHESIVHDTNDVSARMRRMSASAPTSAVTLVACAVLPSTTFAMAIAGLHSIGTCFSVDSSSRPRQARGDGTEKASHLR